MKSIGICKSSEQTCPNGKYWISPHLRIRKNKNGKTYVQQIKGYCCSYHSAFQKIAEEEKMPLDHVYFALTVYGEARSENDASIRTIAWIVQNRFIDKRGGDSYQKVVLRKSQFSCWSKNDVNYEKLKRPGTYGIVDKKAWQKCKVISEEVRNASKDKNPIPGVYNYFSGQPQYKWQENYFDLPDIAKFHFVKLKK